tara:strand:- start:10062 stop:10553 length:492 start_codon:yes stop_codon:yes gene_type:complete
MDQNVKRLFQEWEMLSSQQKEQFAVAIDAVSKKPIKSKWDIFVDYVHKNTTGYRHPMITNKLWDKINKPNSDDIIKSLVNDKWKGRWNENVGSTIGKSLKERYYKMMNEDVSVRTPYVGGEMLLTIIDWMSSELCKNPQDIHDFREMIATSIGKIHEQLRQAF